MILQQLETERLILKKLTPETIAQLFVDLPKEDVCRLLGLRSEEEFLKEKSKSDGGYTTYDRTVVVFLLTLKSTGETIGRGGFHNWYKDHRRAEIGYALNNETHKRKGYMSEAVRAMLDYGFTAMNLNRVEALTSPTNVASINIISRNGFVREGCLRKHYFWEGEFSDSVMFALLKQDYDAQQNQ